MSKILPAFVILLVLYTAGPLTATADTSISYLKSGEPIVRSLPFSEAVRAGDTLYLSGQLGVIPGTLTLVEGGIREQARQTMENIQATLKTQNLSMSHIVKCTVMIADIEEWPVFNEVYVTFFEDNFPARSAFGVNGLALGAKVEIECIAVFT